MNVCENEAVIAFDTLYTQNHIQILKSCCHILTHMVKTISRSGSNIWSCATPWNMFPGIRPLHTKNQTSGTSSPDFAVLI